MYNLKRQNSDKMENVKSGKKFKPLFGSYFSITGEIFYIQIYD